MKLLSEFKPQFAPVSIRLETAADLLFFERLLGASSNEVYKKITGVAALEDSHESSLYSLWTKLDAEITKQSISKTNINIIIKTE